MDNNITVSRMCADMGEPLSLSWVSGQEGGDRELSSDTVQKPTLALIGHLNFVHPNRVQVLGCAEMDFLRGMRPDALEAAVDNLFSTELAAIIIANGEPVPELLMVASRRTSTPLFTSPLPSPRLMQLMSHYLTQELAPSMLIHGVFLEVQGLGLLVTGESAIGKSELALELITRGHRLVADDMVELWAVTPETLEGRCPGMLEGFLEVRGLGVLDIRALFGEPAVKPKKNLKLIVHLEPPGNAETNRLDMHSSTETLLGVTVPKVRIPVAAGRNLAVLVEVAARNLILRNRGINGAETFVSRQRAAMDSSD